MSNLKIKLNDIVHLYNVLCVITADDGSEKDDEVTPALERIRDELKRFLENILEKVKKEIKIFEHEIKEGVTIQ